MVNTLNNSNVTGFMVVGTIVVSSHDDGKTGMLFAPSDDFGDLTNRAQLELMLGMYSLADQMVARLSKTVTEEIN